MSTSAQSPEAEKTLGDFSRLPYQSLPYPQSAPTRLFGLAKLFGLSPADIESCSVLELGCASGGNLIPLAARFPNSKFLGIDLTPRHIEQGLSRIKALNLENIVLRQADVTDIDIPEDAFDCVIAHGLYSWVPKQAREAILRISGHSLRDRGIAYVSYNVFPGWGMRGIIRDLMLYHVGDHEPPNERVAKARWVVDNIAKVTNSQSSYGQCLREEANQLSTSSDSYILGEFLVPDNAPCYFCEFHDAARRHGLAFLSESEIESLLPETYGEEAASLIRAMSADRIVHREQYLDFVMGRTFRETLLVPQSEIKTIQRQISSTRLEGLHLVGKLSFDAEKSCKGKYLFKSPTGRTVTTASEIVRHALGIFALAHPESRTCFELLAEAAEAGLKISSAQQEIVHNTLLRMVAAGIIRVSSAPISVGRADVEYPVAWAIARADASAGRALTTSLTHQTVKIDAVSKILLPHFNGQNNRAQLQELLARAVGEEKITITNNQTGVPLQGEALHAAISEHTNSCISRCSEAALLQPNSLT